MLRIFKVKILFYGLCVLMFLLTQSGVEVRAGGHEDDDISKRKTLKIATWNIKEFGHKYEDVKRSKEDLKVIADILSKYDLVVITEFMSAQIKFTEEKKFEKVKAGSDFKKTLKYLSGDYKYYISEIAGPGYRGDEHYAFLYREGLVEPVIGEGMSGFYPDPPTETRKNGTFSRDPYWATFRAGNFDFTVIVTHTHWGDGKSDPAREHEKLEAVFQHVQDKNGEDENDVILLGDFNLDPDNPKMFLNLDPNDGKPDDDFRKRVDPPITPLFHGYEVKSHIFDTSLYDNIFFQIMPVKEYTGKSGVFYFDEVIFEGHDGKAGDISDHRPVWAEFRIDLKDDD